MGLLATVSAMMTLLSLRRSRSSPTHPTLKSSQVLTFLSGTLRALKEVIRVQSTKIRAFDGAIFRDQDE